MRSYLRFHVYLLPFLVTFVYSFDSWSSLSQGHKEDIEMIDGRVVYYDSELTAIVRKNLLIEINALILQNSQDLRGVDLKEMKERAQKVLLAVADGEPFVGSGYRNGSVNFPQQGLILYNRQKLNSYAPTQKALVYWHEALGAMGYNDDNYLASSSIVKKIISPKEPLHLQIQERLKKQLSEPKINNNTIWRDGGASGVGGGGDGDIAEIKWGLLDYLDLLATSKELGNTSEEKKLIDLAIDTPLESIEFVSKYDKSFSFKNLTIARNKITGKICILVDPKAWKPVDQTQGILSKENVQTLSYILLVLESIQSLGGIP